MKSLDFEETAIYSSCRAEQADSLHAGVKYCVCSAMSKTVLHYMASFHSFVVKPDSMIFPAMFDNAREVLFEAMDRPSSC